METYQYKIDSRKKLLVVGDIHGCLLELKSLLLKANYDSKTDRLVLVGDLIDRGPFPSEVLSFVRENNIETVVGNHDEKAIRYRKYEIQKALTGKKNPMKEPVPQRKMEWNSFKDEDLAYLESMPFILQINEKVVIVHGGLESKYPLDKQDPKKVCRMRYADQDTGCFAAGRNPRIKPENSVDWTAKWLGPQTVLYGHIIHDMEKPYITHSENGSRAIGLDTGGVFGGKLTLCVMEDRNKPEQYDFVQVDCPEYYKSTEDID